MTLQGGGEHLGHTAHVGQVIFGQRVDSNNLTVDGFRHVFRQLTAELLLDENDVNMLCPGLIDNAGKTFSYNFV